jgi:peptide-methionine (R)-S-oxide reductase
MHIHIHRSRVHAYTAPHLQGCIRHERPPEPHQPSHQGRRFVLKAGASAVGLAVADAFGWSASLAHAADADKFEVTRTDAEWRKLLTPNQYAVLRQEGTERPYTSPLNDEHREGRFSCAGCSLDAFSSKTKFDSKTGWPSFWQPLPNAVGQKVDSSAGMTRNEVHCRRCGGHLGHVFDDGPKPTGLRYCMNGLAMKFTPGAA